MSENTSQKPETKQPKKSKEKSTNKKQFVCQFSAPVNLGFQEKIDRILDDPENYQIPDSIFDLHSKTSIASQALQIGLDWLIDHPNQPVPSNEKNLFAQAVAEALLPLIDARLNTIFETSIGNYLNTKSTNLYIKNIMLALKQQLGTKITEASIPQLTQVINKNIDYLVNFEKDKLLQDPKHSVLQADKDVQPSPKNPKK